MVAIQPESNTGAVETGIVSKVGNNLKKILVFGSFAGMGLFATGCATGYVETEPAYVEYSRPAQPSQQHVWVGDNYQYNRHSRVYVQRNGYWSKPNRNKTYTQGHWQTGPNGHYWVNGRWDNR